MRDWISLIEVASDPVLAALDALIAKANEKGMCLKLSADRHCIDLDLIERGGAPAGSGAEIMNDLCKIADQYQRRIELYAYSSSEGLIRYYNRFGFITNPKKDDEAWLVRPFTIAPN